MQWPQRTLAVVLLILFLAGPVAAEYNIVVLPDVQHYSESYPDILDNQTQWIVNNREDIRFVVFLGDLVQDSDNETQWRRVNESVSRLDGVVAYGILPGNHDANISLYERYFPAGRYEGRGYWGGSYNHNRCNYQLLGQDLIVVSLGWNPTDDEIRWANGVLQKYSGRRAVLATHGYMNTLGIRYVHGMGRTTYIWRDLVAPNDNVFLVLCGHAHGEARRTSLAGGRVVHQLLADYQDRENGGNGWLRVITIGEDKVEVKTYSPYLGEYEWDRDSRFTLTTEAGPMDPYVWEVQEIFRSIARYLLSGFGEFA